MQSIAAVYGLEKIQESISIGIDPRIRRVQWIEGAVSQLVDIVHPVAILIAGAASGNL